MRFPMIGSYKRKAKNDAEELARTGYSSSSCTPSNISNPCTEAKQGDDQQYSAEELAREEYLRNLTWPNW